MFWTCNKSFNEQACSVKMQFYIRCSFIIYFFDVVAF